MKERLKKPREISLNKMHFLFMLILGLLIIFEAVSLVNILNVKQKLSTSPKFNLSSLVTQQEKNKEGGIIKVVLEENQKVVPKKTLKAKIAFNSYEEPIGGVDIILIFDPKLISIADISGNRNIFKQIIINTQKQKEGEIKITAYQPTQILKGEAILASLSFQLLEKTPTSIAVKFLRPGEIIDSNLVSQTTQKDILEKIENLNLNYDY